MSCGCEDLDFIGTVGQVRTFTTMQQVVPDDTAAHAAGDVVSGALSFTCVVRNNGGAGTIEEVLLIEKGDATNAPVKPDLELILYDSSAGAPAAQNDPYVAPALPSHIIARVSIAAGDWVNLDSVTAIAQIRPDQLFQVPAGTTTLTGVLITTGAPAWTDNTVQNLNIQLRIRKH